MVKTCVLNAPEMQPASVWNVKMSLSVCFVIWYMSIYPPCKTSCVYAFFWHEAYKYQCIYMSMNMNAFAYAHYFNYSLFVFSVIYWYIYILSLILGETDGWVGEMLWYSRTYRHVSAIWKLNWPEDEHSIPRCWQHLGRASSSTRHSYCWWKCCTNWNV